MAQEELNWLLNASNGHALSAGDFRVTHVPRLKAGRWVSWNASYKLCRVQQVFSFFGDENPVLAGNRFRPHPRSIAFLTGCARLVNGLRK
jgi:hypothetical protein